MNLPRLIGHRGAAGLAPENTLASFREAARLGAVMVEFDVRLSGDGHPMVFHDDTLERTSSGHGGFAALSREALSRLDAGSWFGPAFAGEAIPTLQQILMLCLELRLLANMEIKPDRGREAETARQALETALALWPGDKAPPLISSFSEACLEEAARRSPAWPRGLLVEHTPDDAVPRCRRLGCVALHADHEGLTLDQVADLRDSGLLVLAYTVNDRPRQRELWEAGVSAVFTDFPGSS